MKGIKNIIFDWGNVLIDVRMERFTEECRKAGIMFTDCEVNSAHKAGFFLKYEKGEISDNDFRNELNSRASEKLPDERLDSIWNSMLDEMPRYRLEFLKSIKDKYNLYLLSNTNSIHWETFSKGFNSNGFDIDDLFKGVYLSYRLHIAKPEELIFRKVIDDTGINAGETLFVDDSAVNCNVAGQIGIKTLNFIPGDDLKSSVLKVLE